MIKYKFSKSLLLMIFILFLGNIGCSGVTPTNDKIVELENTGESSVWVNQSEADRLNSGKLFGDTGIPLLGGSGSSSQNGGGGIGVNVYLWRASLDTTSFLPLMSADPFGGVIITDWYSPPETPKERFKLTIYILDKELRADGVKVSLFKQQKSLQKIWETKTINPNTNTKIENAILNRARELRIASVGSQN